MVFYHCNKMELTPDKNYVWGKLVVQGVCLECLRDMWGSLSGLVVREESALPKSGKWLFSPVSGVLVE